MNKQYFKLSWLLKWAILLSVGVLAYEAKASSPYDILYTYKQANNTCPHPSIKASNNKYYGFVNSYLVSPTGTKPINWSLAELDVSGIGAVCKVLFKSSDFTLGDGSAKFTLQGMDGKLYGINEYGGGSDNGSIFVLDISKPTPTYSVLYKFQGGNGKNPLTLIQGSNGKLYGTTLYGGVNDAGVIYELDISSPATTYKVLHEFSGYPPEPNALIEGKDGKLYGTTFYGGSTGYGVFYQIDLLGIFSIIHEFQTPNGIHPPGSLIREDDGTIYGITSYTDPYGLYGYGTVYKVDFSSGKPTHKLVFNIKGTNVQAAHSLIKGSNGKYFGQLGGYFYGWIFQLDLSGLTPVSTVFRNYGDTGYPDNLFYENNGFLIGGFNEGSQLGYGELFRLGTNIPSLSLSTNSNSISTGKEVQITAKLIGGVAPTGTVSLFDYGQFGCPSVLELGNPNLGTFPINSLNTVMNIKLSTSGNHYLAARYDGDSNNNTNMSNCLNFVATLPTAANDSYTLTHSGINSVNIAVPGLLGNDKDTEGDSLNIVGATITSPKIITLTTKQGLVLGGKVSLYPDGHFIYTPDIASFVGVRTFTYQVTDGYANSSPATVTLTIRRNPTALNNKATTPKGTPVVINVLTNDSAGKPATLNPSTVTIINLPQNGSVNVNADGSVTYTPIPLFKGNDSFTYTVRDSFGAISNIATVKVSVL